MILLTTDDFFKECWILERSPFFILDLYILFPRRVTWFNTNISEFQQYIKSIFPLKQENAFLGSSDFDSQKVF